MRLLSIDIETTSLDTSNCQLLQAAFVSYNTKTKEEDSLVVYYSYEELIGSPSALLLNADLIRFINSISKKSPFENEDPSEYLISISKDTEFESIIIDSELCLNFFLKKAVGKSDFIILGKNYGSFDKQVLRRYFGDVIDKLGHRYWDPAVAYYEHGTDKKLPNLELCAQKAGLNIDSYNLHNALSDAKLVIDLYKIYYNV